MAGSTDKPLDPEVPLAEAVSPQKEAPQEKAPLVSIKESAETESLTSVSPPDGGWGWMVVLASFMIHIVGKLPRPSLYPQRTHP